MKLEEILNNPAIMMRLRWDLTKEKLAGTAFNAEDAGFYFCIYVWDGKASLVLMHYYPDGKATQESLTGFPEDMLLAALQDAGGSIKVNGYCPINHPIEEMLRLGLQVARERNSPSGNVEGITMHFNDIKDPALRKLFAQTKHASSTIENDAGDALSKSSNDEELLNNWQSKLMDLYNECQYYWGELENMKSRMQTTGEAETVKEGSQ